MKPRLRYRPGVGIFKPVYSKDCAGPLVAEWTVKWFGPFDTIDEALAFAPIELSVEPLPRRVRGSEPIKHGPAGNRGGRLMNEPVSYRLFPTSVTLPEAFMDALRDAVDRDDP